MIESYLCDQVHLALGSSRIYSLITAEFFLSQKIVSLNEISLNLTG